MSVTVGLPIAHDSAASHVRGDAAYVDDLPLLAGTLHAAIGMSQVAHGHLHGIDLAALREQAGVVDAVAAAGVLGNPNIGPVFQDETLFAQERVEFVGQAVFAVAATTELAARRAARLAVARISELPAVLTIEEALARKSYVVPQAKLPVISRNWDPATLRDSPHVLAGELRNGGQEHFYLEGQVAYAIPQDGGRMLVHASSQHPSEVQHLVAGVLQLALHDVEVEVRRMGGGFGGKETQASQPAAIAALLAHRTGRPVKLRLPRACDFVLTGKRHPFLSRYRAGFDERGKLRAIDFTYAADCGCSADLSLAIIDRALFHADNAYHIRCARLRGYPCKTNKASNTAFRGFGGPQGMLLMERVMEDIARHLGIDALAVRKRNCYQGTRQVTPYGQVVADNVLPSLLNRLARASDYARRRKEVTRFNRDSLLVKRGLALTPVKFGISFTVTHLNQAGALLQMYRDGSVLLNHAGTEMGQGLYVKVAQVAATTLGLPLAQVRCTATNTSKVPNTAPTAASAGTDLNGKAAEDAALQLRVRLAALFARECGVKAAAVRFANGEARAGGKRMTVAALANLAFMNRVSLSARGFYATPDVSWDPVAGTGQPFYYFSYGAAVAEVAIDTLTGEHRLLQVDIIHDVGNSINPAVDRGQVEGGFAQGYGWLTSEELAWDGQGRLQSLGPATYKIPAVGDMPERFCVQLWNGRNKSATINRSKGVGEPPLMLALSAWAALADAVGAARGNRGPVVLDPPATPEKVLLAIGTR